jgi:uncharacterized phage infection (PIP) family protein YhgE
VNEIAKIVTIFILGGVVGFFVGNGSITGKNAKIAELNSQIESAQSTISQLTDSLRSRIESATGTVEKLGDRNSVSQGRAETIASGLGEIKSGLGTISEGFSTDRERAERIKELTGEAGEIISGFLADK